MPVKLPLTAADPHQVADLLHSSAIRLLRRLRGEDAASGLTPSRASALSVLVFGGPCSLGALAEAEGVRPPTMSRLVDGLERDGLARRATDAEDRRAVRIEATARGVRLLAAGRDRRVRRLAAAVAALPVADRGRLARALAVLQTLAREA